MVTSSFIAHHAVCVVGGVTVATLEHASCRKERMAVNCCAIDGPLGFALATLVWVHGYS